VRACVLAQRQELIVCLGVRTTSQATKTQVHLHLTTQEHNRPALTPI